MDITGKMFVSKSQYGGFYTTIKDKKTDTKVYLPVGFKKGAEPEDGCSIDIRNAFLTVFATKGGEAKLKLFVMDYNDSSGAEIAPSGKAYPPCVKVEGADNKSTAFSEADNNDGDLPF